jgi:hypothetical protein
MLSVTVLIEKLNEIQRSIGLESDLTIHNHVIAAQDCALQIQADIAQMLRTESTCDAPRIEPGIYLDQELPHSRLRSSFAAVLPLVAISPLWRR